MGTVKISIANTVIIAGHPTFVLNTTDVTHPTTTGIPADIMNVNSVRVTNAKKPRSKYGLSKLVNSFLFSRMITLITP
jgi:hypothetical protein